MTEGQLVRLFFLLGLIPPPPQKNLRVTFLVTGITITIELVNIYSVCLFKECWLRIFSLGILGVSDDIVFNVLCRQ